MAPPFVLEELKPPFGKPKEHRLIYTKNKYNEKVKVENWQYQPIKSFNPEDKLGPLEKEKERPILSECLCDVYKTSYEEMTNQLHLKENYVNPDKHKQLFNYFGYRDYKVNPENFDTRRNFPTVIKNDHNMTPQFVTTMQSSYASPLGLIMQRLRSPEEKFLLYRRMKSGEGSEINTKFRDDRMEAALKALRCAKQGHYGISYNPMTGFNNDGTVPKEMNFTEYNRIIKRLGKNY